eukprot:TRINITY_DN54259_c0_g1_i1.p1 TRINITY_DN54259_c0_g1~~TRINITY_DN54259_c0_g1_i1.p1  ORF type:complete len:488 (+),score=9.92 TRINITY_DN54259_c0_g1_i1:311-1774(+)
MKLLFLILQRGVHGKLFLSLQSMYKRVKAAVRVGTNITEYFDCISGVRQGCILSPLLFSIFLSELELELNVYGARGIDIFADPLGIFLLMYADDIALVSDSITDLQRKINCLEKYCSKWGLTVNMDKTKVVVFKNGGFVKNCEKWFYAGKEILVEPSYNYLGVIFGSTLNWSKCVQNLSGKALRAVAGIKRLYFRLQNIPTSTVFNIFDTKVKPILLYGSEIWGFQQYNDIDKVQVKICKMIFGVGRYLKNDIALGECGRFPIHIDAFLRMIKYWTKLLYMPDHRYPKQCYMMLQVHDVSGRTNWATHIRKLLCTHGFGYVWAMQDCGDIMSFLNAFKLRLRDIHYQKWHNSLSAQPDYLDYHPNICMANYVCVLESSELRRVFCLLRTNNLPLNGVSRYGNPITNPFCSQCDGQQIEDICHFLFVCPKYASLRRTFIPLYYYRFPSVLKIQLLCMTTNENLITKVGLYLTKCLCIRNNNVHLLSVT